MSFKNDFGIFLGQKKAILRVFNGYFGFPHTI